MPEHNEGKSVTAILNELHAQGKTSEILDWVVSKVPERQILEAIDDSWLMIEYLREAGHRVEER